jgi:hypothetical protein
MKITDSRICSNKLGGYDVSHFVWLAAHIDQDMTELFSDWRVVYDHRLLKEAGQVDRCSRGQV